MAPGGPGDAGPGGWGGEAMVGHGPVWLSDG